MQSLMFLGINLGCWMCKTHYFYHVESYVMEVGMKKSTPTLIICILKYTFYGHTEENLHNCIDSSAITLPHASKPWLPSNVPYLQKVRKASTPKHF